MTQTALTREQVTNAEPGTDLNVMVAEHVFGWKRIEGPEHDYDGPVEHREVLIPPNMSKAHAYAMMPPRGRVELSYFVNRHWSKDIAAAWGVLNIMKQYTFDLFWSEARQESEQWVCIFTPNIDASKYYKVYAGSAPEAICKAALLAVLDI
ncbi:BC1872 family protein [Paenibacillus xylanexedens]|uniref:BC1872 family protein n=1 Tax=Paenibacillus xylanexedens TaxID=528191 RepID=UPI00119F4FD4|nr:hypothetical protein [Paenibacillus xylanexedens]